VPTDGQTHAQTHPQTHRHTDANRFYNLSHAICYSYGTDNDTDLIFLSFSLNHSKSAVVTIAVIRTFKESVHMATNVKDVHEPKLFGPARPAVLQQRPRVTKWCTNFHKAWLVRISCLVSASGY